MKTNLRRVSLKEAEDFHGHLGPWLVVGLVMGEYGLKELSAPKYFGLRIKAFGLNKKPSSCLIDGLQLSTGCTLGKGNIQNIPASSIKVNFYNCDNKKGLSLGLKKRLLDRLKKAKTHKDSKGLAREIYRIKPSNLLIAYDL